MKKQLLKSMFTTIVIIMFGFAIVLTSESKLDENTIAGMWTFEEGKGETVTDLSENGSDGEFVGDLKWVEGKFGGGLEFNGVDTWVKIGTKGDADSLAALDFKDSKGFSIHAWVMSKDEPIGRVIIWKGLGCSTWSQYLLGTGAHENGDGRINSASVHIRTTNGGGRQEALGDPLTDNEWVHMVGVWDTAQLHIYVNGELQNSADAAGPPWACLEEVYIGADPGCNNRGQWNGIMDEIAIFNVALSEDDVKSLGNGIEGALAIDAAGKTTTTWGKLKSVK